MKDTYIGLFKADAPGCWDVIVPDLPGCEAHGSSFKEVLQLAGRAVAQRLRNADRSPPRPRSTVELLIDAQRDETLRRQLVNTAMHPIDLPEEKELAPLELVARRASGESSNPQVGD